MKKVVSKFQGNRPAGCGVINFLRQGESDCLIKRKVSKRLIVGRHWLSGGNRFGGYYGGLFVAVKPSLCVW